LVEHLEAGVLLGAAVLQATFGLFLLVRRPRVEWAVIVAVLFVFNGALSLVGALASFGLLSFHFPTGLGDRISAYFDRATTYLVAYLALAYPFRPGALRRRPWVLPTLFGAGIVLVWALEATVDPRVLRGYDPGTGLGAFSLYSILAYDIPAAVVFPLLLVRWGRLLPREPSPVGRRQFSLLFAAFGMRGAHVIVLQAINIAMKLRTGDLACPARPACGALAIEDTLQVVDAALATVALAWATVHLVVERARAGSDEQQAIGLVLLFVGAGVAEALLSSLGSVFSSEYFTSAVVNLDLLVVRPALVWAAIVRYDLLSLRTDAGRWGLRILAALTVVTVAFGVLGPLRAPIHPLWAAIVLAVAIGAAAGGLVVVLARPFLHGRAAERDSVARYVAALEDAYRNGDPPPQRAAELARLRVALALPEGEARVLESAVRSRWSTPLRQEWLPGDTILGRYAVHRLLGEGGAGQAYLADDLVDGGAVVLKRTRNLSEHARRAMLHEAGALSRLANPHVVRLLRVETLGDEPVLVLEHVPGGSLRDLLDRGKLPWRRARAVLDDLLQGLQAAHEAGIVHRDLKPSNVLLDSDGRAKLADFGIAAGAPERGADLVDATRTQQAPGSLRYMAPEQVRGLAATARSDVYAAALLLLECLTGSHPLPSGLHDYELRSGLVGGLAGHVPKGWPADLRRVLQAALAADPARRPGSARELRAALAAVTWS